MPIHSAAKGPDSSSWDRGCGWLRSARDDLPLLLTTAPWPLPCFGAAAAVLGALLLGLVSPLLARRLLPAVTRHGRFAEPERPMGGGGPSGGPSSGEVAAGLRRGEARSAREWDSSLAMISLIWRIRGDGRCVREEPLHRAGTWAWRGAGLRRRSRAAPCS